MGRAPCCEKVGLKRGRWTAEEDEILTKYIEANGEGSWRSLPKNAGLLRCGKSCRLRWINYLRSDLKRGNISAEEEEIIINLHASLGNRWSIIARHLPGRTDNEIKNYWNSNLSRKIQSYRRPNPNFFPPAVAAKPDRRGGRRTGRSAKKKGKNSDRKSNPKPSEQREDSDGGANAAVVMPTTPTPETESLSRTTQRQENNGGEIIPESSPQAEEGEETGTEERESRSLMLLPINEGTGVCDGTGELENGVLCLDEMIMEDLSGIWALERELEIGAVDSGEMEFSGPGNGNCNSGSEKNGDWNLMSSPGNSREFSRAEKSGPGNGDSNSGSEKNGDWNLMGFPGNSWEWDWGQEENTFSWFWDGADDAKMEFDDGVSFEMDTEKHDALVSWLMS